MTAAQLASYAVSTEQGEATRADLKAKNDTQYPNGTVRKFTLRGVVTFKAFGTDGKLIGSYKQHATAARKVA
jgi:hypothetical protein